MDHPGQAAGHRLLCASALAPAVADAPEGTASLVVQMASAGRDRGTPCFREYERGRAAWAAGALDDPATYFEWHAAPEDLDPASEAAWRAANPAAGATLSIAGHRRACTRLPEAELRRVALNQWAELEPAWLPAGAWDACAGEEQLRERAACVVAIDASTRVDATAVAVLQPRGDRTVARCRLWERPRDLDGRPREDWRVPIEEVKDHVRALCRRFEVRAVGYDPAYLAWTAQELEAEGLPLVEIPQTHARMAPASQGLYELIVQRRLRHDGDPALAAHIREAVAAAVPDGGWRLAKGPARRPIDGAIALAMCAYLLDDAASGAAVAGRYYWLTNASTVGRSYRTSVWSRMKRSMIAPPAAPAPASARIRSHAAKLSISVRA